MTLTIAWFELRMHLQRVSTYVYFLLFFTVSLLMVMAAGGAWDSANVGLGGEKVAVNSPFSVLVTIGTVTVFGFTIVAAMMGHALQKDFEYRVYHLFFVTPVRKREYVGGRFLGALLTLLLIFSSVGLGAFIATLLPNLSADKVGPIRPLAYLLPYLYLVLPNFVLLGVVCCALASFTRKMLPVYVASVVVLIGYLAAGSLTQDVEYKTLAALLDPFGMNAVGRLTEYWSVDERNARLVLPTGELLWNRLLWTAVAFAIAAFAYWRFSFSHFMREGSGQRIVDEPEEILAAAPETAPGVGALRPGVTWSLFWQQIKLNVVQTVQNRYFFAILLVGVLLFAVAVLNLGAMFGTKTYLVTYQMIDVASGSFSLVFIIIVTFYAGELVWREREHGISQLFDVLPQPSWLPMAAKFIALCTLPLLIQTMVLLCCVTYQLINGYTNIEFDQYLLSLYVLGLPRWWLACVLAFGLHVWLNNKLASYAAMIAYYLVFSFMPLLGFEHRLYRLFSLPGVVYSDMNGYGQFLPRYLAYLGYWGALAVLMVIAAWAMWPRGTIGGWRERWQRARATLRPSHALAAGLALMGFAGLGGMIYHHTNRLTEWRTDYDREKLAADYEKKFKAVENLPQPRVVAAAVNVDLFPREQRMHTTGSYRLQNKTAAAIDTVYVTYPAEMALTVNEFKWSVPATEAERDTVLGVVTYRLPKPLQPGQEVEFSWNMDWQPRGMIAAANNTQLVENGSFFGAMGLFPNFGYLEMRELETDKSRKKFGLTPKERMLDRDDAAGLANNYISRDADWIDFKATISTDDDQIALAPGYLQREWRDGGRRHFEYAMDSKILRFFAFLSGRYTVQRDVWNPPEPGATPGGSPVNIEIYHHPSHDYNVQRMIKASKLSFDYFTRNFGPYQHRQFRVIEFPRYHQFAQAFPNTIPYSESIGFIAKVNDQDEKDIDYPTYVTAHELAHQWWAHQVIGAHVQGSTLLSETLAQYSSLMVMKHLYGDIRMQRFLRYELDRYLTGRALENKKELPLGRVENQQYIHYAKGSLAMYWLQDVIGEERVNQALRKFREEVAFQGPPYPNATQLIQHLREVTPADQQYLIDDLFESITLYENRAIEATAKPLDGGRYEVRLKAGLKKLRADALGKESEVPLDDLVEIGVFDADKKPLLLEKRRFKEAAPEVVVVVNGKPAKAGIDPLNKLIDRVPGDNQTSVKGL